MSSCVSWFGVSWCRGLVDRLVSGSPTVGALGRWWYASAELDAPTWSLGGRPAGPATGIWALGWSVPARLGVRERSLPFSSPAGFCVCSSPIAIAASSASAATASAATAAAASASADFFSAGRGSFSRSTTEGLRERCPWPGQSPAASEAGGVTEVEGELEVISLHLDLSFDRAPGRCAVDCCRLLSCRFSDWLAAADWLAGAGIAALL